MGQGRTALPPHRGRTAPPFGRAVRLGFYAAVLATLGAVGCEGCEGCGAGEAAETLPPAPPAPPAKTVVEGVVRLAEGHQLPLYEPSQMEKKVLDHTQHAALPSSCTPPKVDDRRPVTLTSDGLLTGVMVAASDFSQAPAYPPTVREVKIRDCRLTPSLVVAQKGDILRIENEVDYAFMPSYQDTGVVKTLVPGQKLEEKLDKPGVKPILCGFTAPCGRTDVVVLHHPFHAVTGADGKFRIEDFPHGEPVTLSAWHPLFADSSIQLQVAEGEHKHVELVLTPAASTAAAAPDGGAPVAPATAKPSATGAPE